MLCTAYCHRPRGSPSHCRHLIRSAGVALALKRQRRWPVRRFHSRGTPDLQQVGRTLLAYASVLPSVLTGVGIGLLNRSHRDAVMMMAVQIARLTG